MYTLSFLIGFLLLCSSALTQSIESQCFWPNGSPAPDQAPCNAQSSGSFCCGVDDVCLDNGYCLQTSNIWTARIGRAACTDQTWQSSGCPFYCQDVYTNDSTSLFLAYDTPNGAFCCHENFNTTTGRCAIATRGSYTPFDLPSASVIYNRTDGSTSPNNTDVAATVTVTATPTSSASGSVNVTALAAGIAAPLGALLLAAIAVILTLLGRNKKVARELDEKEKLLQNGSIQRGESFNHQSPYSAVPPGYRPNYMAPAPQHELESQAIAEVASNPRYEVPVAMSPAFKQDQWEETGLDPESRI